MTYIGRLEGFGIALEDQRGVAKAPTIWIKQSEASFQDVYENIADESALGIITSSSGSKRVKQSAEGEISAILSANTIGYFLSNIIGTPTTTEINNAYKHSFVNEETNTKRSFTISKKNPLSAKQYALGMLSSLGITTSIGESIISKFLVKSKAGVDGTLIKAYTQDSKFYAKDLKVYIADDIAGLDSANAICISSFELNLVQPLEEDYCLGSGVDLGELYNTDIQTEISIDKIKKDNTFENLAKDLTNKAMRIEIIDTSKTIGDDQNPTIKIDLSKITIEEYETSGALNEIVKESFKIKAHYDEESAKYINIELINEVQTY